MSGLDDIDNSSLLGLDMKFFCPVVDINQKKVIQKKILDKVILVKTFFICSDQILQLADADAADHMYIFSRAPRDQDIFGNIFPGHFEKMKSLYFLAVRRGRSKLLHCIQRKFLIPFR